MPQELKSIISNARGKFISAVESFNTLDKMDKEVLYFILKCESKSLMIEKYAAECRQQILAFLLGRPISVALPSLEVKLEGKYEDLQIVLAWFPDQTYEGLEPRLNLCQNFNSLLFN